MKINRLPEIELARIAPLDKKEKIAELIRFDESKPPMSYRPMRFALRDIANVQNGLFPELKAATPWKNIDEGIVKKSHSPLEEKCNREVGKALHDFFLREKVISFEKHILPWDVGFGQSVKYWFDFYSVIDGCACFIFLDPRVNKGLTSIGRRFVQSLMFERICAAEPDFSDSKLLVLSTPKDINGLRICKIHDDDKQNLFSVVTLNEMIDETYQIWAEIIYNKTAKKRGSSSGGSLL